MIERYYFEIKTFIIDVFFLNEDMIFSDTKKYTFKPSLEFIAKTTELLKQPIVVKQGTSAFWTNGAMAGINDPNLINPYGQELENGIYTISFENGLPTYDKASIEELKQAIKVPEGSFDTHQRMKKPTTQLAHLALYSDNIEATLKNTMENRGLEPIRLGHAAVHNIGKNRYHFEDDRIHSYFTDPANDSWKADNIVLIGKQKQNKSDDLLPESFCIYRQDTAIIGASVLGYNQKIR